MNKVFSFNEACEKGIDKIKGVNWPDGQYIELSLIGVVPKPFVDWYDADGDLLINMPTCGIEPEAKTFTFIDGIESYEEYADKYIYPVLIRKASAMAKTKRKR